MRKSYLEMGEIVTTHGVTGECKVYPWCDDPAAFSDLKKVYLDAKGQQSFAVLAARVQNNMVLLRLEGIDTVETARRLVGKTLYADRRELFVPEGRCFIQDLCGCTVRDAATGRDYGTLLRVSHPANCDIYEIGTPDGKEVLFPAVPEYLDTVDIDAGVICIRPIKGMFDDAD